MTADEVRTLDNKKAILLIRGEDPIVDEKYNTFKHPNFKYTEDGGYKPYIHNRLKNVVASILFDEEITKNAKEMKVNSNDYEILIDEEIDSYILEKKKQKEV